VATCEAHEIIMTDGMASLIGDPDSKTRRVSIFVVARKKQIIRSVSGQLE
jgi:hypothetical protein